MKIGSLNRKALLVLLATAFLQISAFASDAKDVIKSAKNSYYSLKDHGLKSFNCEVAPDWRKFLESVDKKAVSADDARLKKFEGLRFTVAVDEQGHSTITPFMADGSPVQASLNQMISGFKKMVSGFYELWTPLVLTNPFDGDNSSLTLKQEGEDFHLAGKANGADVEILLDKNYAITKMTTLLDGSKTTVSPVFEKTVKGLLLASVNAEIKEGAQKILLEIQYQELQGLQLPRAAIFKVTLPNQSVLIDIALSKYQITKQ